jgi:hypothetical protein
VGSEPLSPEGRPALPQPSAHALGCSGRYPPKAIGPERAPAAFLRPLGGSLMNPPNCRTAARHPCEAHFAFDRRPAFSTL